MNTTEQQNCAQQADTKHYHVNYPCGCEASGPFPLPNYCAKHARNSVSMAPAPRAKTGKELLTEKIASLVDHSERVTKRVNYLRAFHDSIPDRLTPEAEKGLRFVVSHLVSILLFVLMLAGTACADDKPLAEAPDKSIAPTNFPMWMTTANGREYFTVKAFEATNSWLMLNSLGWTNTAPAVTTITSKREPIVTKGTNGTWTISFPDVVAPPDRITTTGQATESANVMFKQGAGFGALAKDRNKDVDDVPSLVIIAEKLWNQARGK